MLSILCYMDASMPDCEGSVQDALDATCDYSSLIFLFYAISYQKGAGSKREGVEIKRSLMYHAYLLISLFTRTHIKYCKASIHDRALLRNASRFRSTDILPRIVSPLAV